MKVQRADNGWDGIFIPGDEAMSLSRDLLRLARCLDGGSLGVTPSQIAAFMRHTAEQLSACEQRESAPAG